MSRCGTRFHGSGPIGLSSSGETPRGGDLGSVDDRGARGDPRAPEVVRPRGVGDEGAGPGVAVDLAEGADTAPLVALLVNLGAAVREVRVGSTSLEEAFMELLSEEADT